jgi:hypothetical protein
VLKKNYQIDPGIVDIAAAEKNLHGGAGEDSRSAT